MPYKNKKDRNKSQLRYIAKKHEKFVQYLEKSYCMDCGEDDIIVLELDHRPDEIKKFGIASAVTSGTRSWKSILEEIEKCDVVCANCHKRRTSQRLDKHYRRDLSAPNADRNGTSVLS